MITRSQHRLLHCPVRQPRNLLNTRTITSKSLYFHAALGHRSRALFSARARCRKVPGDPSCRHQRFKKASASRSGILINYDGATPAVNNSSRHFELACIMAFRWNLIGYLIHGWNSARRNVAGRKTVQTNATCGKHMEEYAIIGFVSGQFRELSNGWLCETLLNGVYLLSVTLRRIAEIVMPIRCAPGNGSAFA